MLRSLLELGQLESVLNQVGGIVSRSSGAIDVAFMENNLFFSEHHALAELLPSASEAAWRLGRWSVLDNLVKDKENKHTSGSVRVYNTDSLYHINLGRAMLGLHRRDKDEVLNAVEHARMSVMTSLASVARESYSRCYPHLLRLHCLREIDNATDFLCPEIVSGIDPDSTLANYPISNFSDLASSDCPFGWDWGGRLRMAAPELAGASAIVNVRLALSKIAEERILEGKLWLATVKSARKAGLISISQTALGHAEHALKRVNLTESPSNKPPLDLPLSNYWNEIHMQQAKLKHVTGESSVALQMMNMEDIETSDLLKQDHSALKESILRMLNGPQTPSDGSLQNLGNQNEEQSLRGFGRRLLQATEWVVEGCLKSGAEVIDRYKLTQRVCPKWERAHFKFARYIDSMLEARIAALAGRENQRTLDDDAARMNILRSDPSCHKYLLDEFGSISIQLSVILMALI